MRLSPDASGTMHEDCLDIKRSLDEKYPGLAGMTDEPEPYRKVAAAIAIQAIEDLRSKDSRDRAAAHEFIFGRTRYTPSFEDICLALGIDLARAREHLRKGATCTRGIRSGGVDMLL